MKVLNTRTVFFLASLCCSLVVFAQEQMTMAEYQVAIDYTYGNLMNKKVFNLDTDVYEFEDDSGIWFVDYAKDQKTYKTLLFKSGRVKPLFDQEKLAVLLSEKVENQVEANKLSISKINKTKDGYRFEFDNKSYIWNTKTGVLDDADKKEERKRGRDNQDESKSPDGKWVAFVKEHNLFIKSTESDTKFSLTTDGEKGWRNRDSEFTNSFLNETEMMNYWNKGWECLLTTLEQLSEKDLVKIIYIRNDGHTVVEAINRQLAHYPYHIGQMVFIAKMLKNEGWNTLSIARNKSGDYNNRKFAQEKSKRHYTDDL